MSKPRKPDPVRDAALQLARDMMAAELLVTRPDEQQHILTKQVPQSSLPGNAPALEALMNAHQGVRRLEALIRAQVTGRPYRRRGGADAQTTAALSALVSYANAVTRDQADEAKRELLRLSRPIELLRALDEALRWVPIRLGKDADPATLPPTCPYCGKFTLRLAESRYIVACVNPGCPGDLNGEQPATGWLEVHALHGASIVWADGTIQTARRVTADDAAPTITGRGQESGPDAGRDRDLARSAADREAALRVRARAGHPVDRQAPRVDEGRTAGADV